MSRRLNLSKPSELYDLFILKSDHVNMMIRLGYIVDDIERSFAVETSEIDDKMNRYKIFQSIYQRDGLPVERSALNKFYKHTDKNVMSMDVIFTSKDKIKDHKNAQYQKGMIEAGGVSSRQAVTTVYITKERVPDDARPKMYDMVSTRYILDRQITFDVTEHHYGTHQMYRLTPHEKEEFFEQEGLNGKLLTQILSTDPVVFVNGWKLGDVIRITRENVFTSSVSSSITYREVVKPPPVKQKVADILLSDMI